MATRSTADVSASPSSTIKRGDAPDYQSSPGPQHNERKRPPDDSNDKDQKKECSNKRTISSETDALSTSPRQQPVLQQDVQGSVGGTLPNTVMLEAVSYRIMKGFIAADVSLMQQRVESMIQEFVTNCYSPQFRMFCESQDFHGRKLAETQYHYLVPAASLMKRFQDAICNFSPKEVFAVAVVFHGTPKENIPGILAQGLDPTLRKRGSGDHFATHPCESSRYCGCFGYEMLVFLVVEPLSWHPRGRFLLVERDTSHQLPIGTMTFRYAGLAEYSESYRTMTGLMATDTAPVLQQVESLIQEFVAYCQSPKFRKFCETQDHNGGRLTETQFHYRIPEATMMKRFQNAISQFSPKEEFAVAVVFHGTPKENIPTILGQGLDPTLRKRGSGDHFATHPCESSRYCRGGREMLAFLVVVPLSREPRKCHIEDISHQLPIGTMTFRYPEDSVSHRSMKGLIATNVSPMQHQVESLIQEFVADCQSPKFRKFCETQEHSARRLTVSQFHYQVPEPSLMTRFQNAISKFPPKEEFTVAVVFHGTPAENIPNILAQGLDPTLRKRRVGDYFATRPSISTRYCRGGYEMLVFLVVVPVSGHPGNRSILVVQDTSHQLPIGTMTFRCQAAHQASKSFKLESISTYQENRYFQVTKVLSSTSLDLYNVDSLIRSFRQHLGSIDFRKYCEAHGLESACLVSTPQYDPDPDLQRRFQSSVCSSSGDFTIALVFRGVRPTLVATVMKKGLTDSSRQHIPGLCTGDYFTKDPSASVWYSHGGKCILAFLVMLPTATAEAFASDHFVVAPVEHQLPLAVVQFHAISAPAWELSCGLHRKVLQQECDKLDHHIREGHAKNHILELLAIRDISLASETFEKEKTLLLSESRREIGMYAYRKFDAELVQCLFPGLENPRGESVDFLVENMSSLQEMERLARGKREKLQESRLVAEAARRRPEQHVVFEYL